MGLNSANKIDTNEFELEISVDKDKFQNAVSAAYKKNAPKMAVPGFRKGKAPRHLIEKLYGERSEERRVRGRRVLRGCRQ